MAAPLCTLPEGKGAHGGQLPLAAPPLLRLPARPLQPAQDPVAALLVPALQIRPDQAVLVAEMMIETAGAGAG